MRSVFTTILWSCLLGGVLAASSATAVELWPFKKLRAPKLPDVEEDLGGAAATLLSEAIRFDTVNPPGDELPLAEFLVGHLERAGLEARVVETPRGRSNVGRAAAWARYRGTGEQPAVVLLSHLDVVPARGEEWIADPFEGVVSGGYVLGRGALDAKGLAVMHALTMMRLARRSEPLSRDVILLAVPDEETGGKLGAGYVVEREPGLVQGAGFLLGEGGAILASDGSGPDLWGVSFTEKTPCWLRLVVEGQPGHGSTAGPEASVPVLVRALERIRNFETGLRVAPEVARMFEVLARHAPEEDREGYAGLARALADDPEFRTRFLSSRVRNALVRDTVAITVLRGGDRTNVMPARATAHIDARILPGGSCTALREDIFHAIDDPRVELDTLLEFSNRTSSLDTPLVRAIEAASRAARPAGTFVPRVSSGFTDSHYFRDLGIEAYGFAPLRLEPAETRGVHGTNERVSIENLERAVEILLEILDRMDGEPAP